MATEEDRQDERDRLGSDPLEAPPADQPGSDPLEAPPAEQLEEENPTESPASDSGDQAGGGEDDEKRASSSAEPPRSVGKSTEGLTVGGSEKQPDDRAG
jgi:hypothetical protein